MALDQGTELPAGTPLEWREPPPVVDRSQDYTVVITVRMKRPLKKRLDERSHKEQLSLNQLCVRGLELLCNHLDALDAAEQPPQKFRDEDDLGHDNFRG